MVYDVRWGGTSQYQVEPLDEEEIEVWKYKLRRMTISDLVVLQRYTKVGHPVFTVPQLHAEFVECVAALGGITPEAVLAAKLSRGRY